MIETEYTSPIHHKLNRFRRSPQLLRNFNCVLWLVVLSMLLAMNSGFNALRADTIVVNSTADPAGFNPAITIANLGSTVTLRDAWDAAINKGGANTITFAPSLAGQTINLTQIGSSGGISALAMENRAVASDITIQGLTGANGITIARSGTNQMRLFLCGAAGYVDSCTLNDLTLSNGVAPNGNWGGAIEGVIGYVNLNRCTLTGNSAYLGGALYNRQGYMNLNNCTIVNNSADYQTGQGGGIYQDVGSQINLNCCTIVSNSAAQGAGIYVYATPYPVLVDTIVASNVARINFPEIGGQVSSSSHNNLCSDPGGTPVAYGNGAGNMQNGINSNIIGVDPFLGPLANNGGPTMTMALSLASPAINSGSLVSGVTTDQRGQFRPQFAAPDIGAFEATASDLGLPGVTTGDANWYLGPPAIGNDWHIYRSVPGVATVTVDGFAARLGLANDGSVLVENSGLGVYDRIGSTNGVGSGWQLLTSVTAGDGATWFLGADGVGADSYIYRWAAGGAPTYASGYAMQISVDADGSILVKNSVGDLFRRVGSNAGLGSAWQQVNVVNTPVALKVSGNPASGQFTLNFSSQASGLFTVLTSTNLSVSATNWIPIGVPVENPAGQYSFTNATAAGEQQRFYRVTSP